MGSINDAKKAPVENIASAIEIFACLMDSKNVIQCKAIIIPAIENLAISKGLTFKSIFENLIKMNIKTAAMIIRNQTNGTEPILISSPRIAVKPAIKTKKWR